MSRGLCVVRRVYIVKVFLPLGCVSKPHHIFRTARTPIHSPIHSIHPSIHRSAHPPIRPSKSLKTQDYPNFQTSKKVKIYSRRDRRSSSLEHPASHHHYHHNISFTKQDGTNNRHEPGSFQHHPPITHPCPQTQSSNGQSPIWAQQTPQEHTRQLQLRTSIPRKRAKNTRRTPDSTRYPRWDGNSAESSPEDGKLEVGG